LLIPGLDGTIWTKIEQGGVAGRVLTKNNFIELYRPTAYAKRYTMKDNCSSALFLLIDNHILSFIQKCTEEEASRVLGKKMNPSN
jgi:hypothetical protein